MKRIILAAALLFLSLSAPVHADEPGAGMIEGQVINGTAGGSSVADQEIALTTYLDDAQTDTAPTTRTDAEGRFMFEGLDTAAGYSYEALFHFQGADYNSERLQFAGGETAMSTVVNVYDSTTSDETVMVAMSHMIIYPAEGGLLVKVYYVMANMSDRTYIGADGDVNMGVLRFPMPKGATGLQPGTGLMACCVVQTDEGFNYTMPLLPGSEELAYSYNISPGSGDYTLPKVINYPVVRFDLLVQAGGIQASSDRLSSDDTLDISNVQYNHLSGQELAKGERLEIRLSGLPSSGTPGGLIWLLLGVIVVAAGSVYIYLMKKRGPQPVPAGGGPGNDVQMVLAELARLDDDFEDGRIPEESYRRLRAEKKAALRALMQDSKEESSDR